MAPLMPTQGPPPALVGAKQAVEAERPPPWAKKGPLPGLCCLLPSPPPPTLAKCAPGGAPCETAVIAKASLSTEWCLPTATWTPLELSQGAMDEEVKLQLPPCGVLNTISRVDGDDAKAAEAAAATLAEATPGEECRRLLPALLVPATVPAPAEEMPEAVAAPSKPTSVGNPSTVSSLPMTTVLSEHTWACRTRGEALDGCLDAPLGGSSRGPGGPELLQPLPHCAPKPMPAAAGGAAWPGGALPPGPAAWPIAGGYHCKGCGDLQAVGAAARAPAGRPAAPPADPVPDIADVVAEEPAASGVPGGGGDDEDEEVPAVPADAATMTFVCGDSRPARDTASAPRPKLPRDGVGLKVLPGAKTMPFGTKEPWLATREGLLTATSSLRWATGCPGRGDLDAGSVCRGDPGDPGDTASAARGQAVCARTGHAGSVTQPPPEKVGVVETKAGGATATGTA